MFRKSAYRIAAAVGLAAVVAGVYACGSADNTYSRPRLHGDAEVVETMRFDAVENGGEVERGRFAGSVMERMDGAGRMVYRETHGADGALGEWTDIYYGAGGLVDSVAVHSVIFGGDRVLKTEYGDDGDRTVREYAPDGGLLRTVVCRNGRRTFGRDTLYPDGTVRSVRGKMRNGRAVKEIHDVHGGVQEIVVYDYDDAGNMTSRNISAGEVTCVERYDYTDTDSCGNWTRRVKYAAGADGVAAAVSVEMRRIGYRGGL